MRSPSVIVKCVAVLLSVMSLVVIPGCMSKDEEAIKTVVRAVNTAIEGGDADALASHLTTETMDWLELQVSNAKNLTRDQLLRQSLGTQYFVLQIRAVMEPSALRKADAKAYLAAAMEKGALEGWVTDDYDLDNNMKINKNYATIQFTLWQERRGRVRRGGAVGAIANQFRNTDNTTSGKRYVTKQDNKWKMDFSKDDQLYTEAIREYAGLFKVDEIVLVTKFVEGATGEEFRDTLWQKPR